MKHTGHARWFRAFVALVFLASTAIPAFMWMDGMKAYAISPEVEKVIGGANKNLSAKFSFDEASNKWQFNKNGAAALAANIAKQQGTDDVDGVAGALSQLTAKQVGGAGEKDTSLYSVDLPAKAKEGITYYDNVNKLSFKMVPDFGARDGKLVQDRIVYPFGDGAQVVYTAKANGLKEDIVLSKYIADTLRYSYNLELPETLEAKLLDDGSIGIYSANLALFGNVSFSGDEDKARVMDARKTGTKDNLVFNIPAPFIKDQTGNAGHTRYLLNGSRVTVVADQLKNLKYPLTVDPTVIVSSSADFETDGNSESNLSYGTDEIKRGSVSGGSVGTWGSQTATPGCDKRVDGQNNGYVYCIDGTTVRYARLSTTGTIAVGWTTGTALAQAYTDRAGFIYNGYLYVTGGNFTGTARPDTYYIKLNSDGTMAASWTTGTTLNTSRYVHTALAYNGTAYVIGGGLNGSNRTASIEYATINANGSLSNWTATTSAPTVRWEHTSAVYNGYLYVFGGQDNGGPLTDAQYIPINSDGTLGSSWITTTVIPGFSNRRNTAIAYMGYMYLVGGYNSVGVTCTSDVRYAMIRANGSLGEWVSTTSPTITAGHLCYPLVVQYHDYIVTYGGQNTAGTKLTGVYSVQASPAGATDPYGTAGTYDTAGRTAFASVTYNNFIYIIAGNGGNTGGGGGMLKSIRYAAVDAQGAVGSWSVASNDFNNTSGGTHACAAGCNGRTGLAAGVYNGYLYIAGGNSNGGNGSWSDVQSARICTGVNLPVAGCGGAGDLRPWTPIFTDFTTNSTTTYTDANGLGHLSMAIYNGVMYLMGGVDSGTTATDKMYQSTLTTSGGAGNFSLSSVVLPAARKGVKAFASNNRLYIVGGGTGAGWTSRITSENTEVKFIPINSGGGLDNVTGWKDANAVPNGGSGSSFLTNGNRDAYSIAVSNSQLYVTGGDNSGGTAQSTVYRATINANGSMGTWATTASFATARYGHATHVINGFLYIIGGCDDSNPLGTIDCNSTATTDQLVSYQHARINNGGSGTTGAWTASASNGSAAIGGYTSYNGYVYSIRGCGGGIGVGDLNCDNVGSGSQGMVYAAVNADGSFGSWQTLSSSGTPLGRAYGLSAVAHNGYLYVVGGCTTYASSTCTVMSNKVYYAAINATTGDVGPWAATTDFDASVGRYGLSAVAHNGYLYVVGGCTATSAGSCTAYENTVRVAQIDSSNGTVGTWNSAGANFSTARFWHSAVVYNNALYVLGGCSAMVTEGCTGLQNDIQTIGLAGNGSFSGSWQAVRSFVTPRSAFGAVAYNGYLYVVGGCAQFNTTGGNCSDYKNDVQYAPILSGGDVGVWQKSVTNMTEGILGNGLAIANGNLVTLFGIKTPHSFEAVARSSPITVQSRVSKYSKLLPTTNSATDIASVYYNGSVGAGSSLTYRVAPGSGIFGSALSGTQGTGSEPTRLCGTSAIHYVHIMATMDDGNRAVFPDDNIGNVTDITVYYRLNATPPPNLRMTGGKWFLNEQQRELDTCKETNAT